MNKIIIPFLILISAILELSAQCLALPSELSSMPKNPLDENGVFQFDLKIYSEVNTYTDGELNVLEMIYYVNTADNSMYFPDGFFKSNFGTNESRDGRIDGSIWMANGQMVNYVYDSKNDIKRAMTIEINQTADDVHAGRLSTMTQWFTRLGELTEIPEAPHPLPDTEGFIAPLRSPDGVGDDKLTVFFDIKSYDVKTTPLFVGFMVGILKDNQLKNCNRLAVFTKIEMHGSNNYLEAELISFDKETAKFDAADYKPMYLFAQGGTDRRAQMNDFRLQMETKSRELQTLKEERKRCADNSCYDRYDRWIEDLKNEIDLIECKLLKTMGLGDTIEDCE